jgi:hypothetical protein
MRLRPPNAAVSFDEFLQVYNDDLAELTPGELWGEVVRAARIAARDPRAFVWRGPTWISAREWADERIKICRALLGRKSKVGAWSL